MEHRWTGPSRTVERIRPADLVELASDVGPVPMNVGLLLVLGAGARSPADVEAALVRRTGRVGRLRQHLVVPPRVLGRPYWAEDADFDAHRHVSHLRSAEPYDLEAQLVVAADALTQPLPPDRPLWRAVVVSGVDDAVALSVVVVLHHVVTDGVGGLTLLARLMDGGDGGGDAGTLRGPPRTGDLLADVLAEVVRRGRAVPGLLAASWRGIKELGVGRPGGHRAPRCSLNSVPTGGRRRVTAVTVELEPVHAAARRHGCTVNDVLLVATTGALASLLRARGESVPELVVSVPVSGRTSTSGRGLGNDVGVMPIRVPVTGGPAERLARVAGTTRERRGAVRGSSRAVIGPIFRVLAATGLFRRLIDRQRLVNTFVSNVRGPADRLRFDGAPIVTVVPLSATAGNVSVAFTALSVAGLLTVSIVVDPDLVTETGLLRAALHDQLRDVVAEPPPGRDRAGRPRQSPAGISANGDA